MKRAARHRRPWTQAEQRQLAALWPTATRTKRIARALSRSVDACARRASQLGLHRPDRTWTAREDRLLKRLTEEGYAPRTVRSQLPGRSAAAIHLRRQQLGVSARPQGYAHPTAIAKAHGVDVSTVLAACRWAGVAITGFAGVKALKLQAAAQRHLVDRADAEEALEAYRNRATSIAILRVTGIDSQTLRRLLRKEKLYPKRPLRKGTVLEWPWETILPVVARHLKVDVERVRETARRMGYSVPAPTTEEAPRAQDKVLRRDAVVVACSRTYAPPKRCA